LRKLERDVFLFNLVSAILVWPKAILYNALKVDENASHCQAMYMVAFAVYAIFKLQSYRLLISKSQVYDAMRQYKRLYTFVWYFTHLAYLVMAICFFFVIILSEYTIEHNPTPSTSSLCVLTPPTPYVQAALFVILAGFDTWICTGSLALLWLPVRGANVQHAIKVAVARNFIGGGIAILSTLAFGLFSMALDVTGSYYPSVIVMAGMYDELINTVALNLTYPIIYYIHALGKILKGISECVSGPSEGVKGVAVEGAKEQKGRRSNSRMNWVMRMHTKSEAKSPVRLDAAKSPQSSSPCNLNLHGPAGSPRSAGTDRPAHPLVPPIA